MSNQACPHRRTILVAKDRNEEYLECLDCGAIFDPAEGEPSTPAAANFDDESLSEA